MNAVLMQPVGLPGLIAFAAGALLFFASLSWTRIGADRGDKSAPAARSQLSRWGVFIQMLGFFAAGFGGILIGLAPTSPAALVEGAAVALLMLMSVGLFGAAARAMGANWSIVARMREGHELVTGGVFSRLRHPIYTAMAAFLVAMAIAFGHFAGLVLGAPLFALGTWIRIREEERLLRAEFGPAYEAYAARVKRFVPGFF
ncbi:MAG TPA: isoprenylcysteine carboxylmethyltransferase family protein [Allosphingosinicella sp.]|nr:isoprenylcysteine carboxylmethyltransferase family protein [Allosphingosinicella sp.]